MALSAWLAAAVVLWRSRTLRCELPSLAWAGICAAFIPGVQALGGLILYRGDAVVASTYLVAFALALVVGAHAAAVWGRETVLDALAGTVLVAALISAYLALYQWLGLDYLGAMYVSMPGAGQRPYANLNQPNQLATLLVLALLATARMWDTARVGATGSCLAVLLLGLGLAATQSRAGQLEIALAALLIVGRSRLLRRRLTPTQVLSVAAIVLAMTLVWEPLTAMIASSRTSAMATEANQHRLAIWSLSIDAITRSPWWGYGWVQTAVAEYLVAPDHPPVYQSFGSSHNLLLDLLVWNGVPIGALLVGLLVAWGVRRFRALADSTGLLSLAWVTAVFTHAMVEFPLFYTYFLLPTAVVMGSLTDIRADTRPARRCSLATWLPPLMLLVTGGAAATITREYLEIEQDVLALRFESARIGTHLPLRAMSEPWLLTQFGAFTRVAREPVASIRTAEQLNGMRDITRRYPSSENMVRYALALALNERPDEAAETLGRICKISHPTSCAQAKARWNWLGEREPAVARVAWPADR